MVKLLVMLPRNVYFYRNFCGNIEYCWVTNTELEEIKSICARKNLDFVEEHVKENKVAYVGN